MDYCGKDVRIVVCRQDKCVNCESYPAIAQALETYSGDRGISLQDQKKCSDVCGAHFFLVLGNQQLEYGHSTWGPVQKIDSETLAETLDAAIEKHLRK